MIVTVNTDASFSNIHKKCSFAFWIVCNDFKILKSGLLKGFSDHSRIAEFKCIINALHVLFNEDCKKVHKIIINTDCLDVIHIIEKDKAKIERYRLKWGNELMKRFEEMIFEKNMGHVEIEMRHVKSHTGKADARSYVNEWCDTHAKKHLGKYLESLS
jgi:ribonuclease HI